MRERRERESVYITEGKLYILGKEKVRESEKRKSEE
jgi:hypothetical protein